MQAVILAGGLGTRLRPLTETLPKAMAPVCGRPFLEHQLQYMRDHGVDDVVVCLGHLGHMIEQHFGDGRALGLRIRYGYERDRLLGTAGAVKNVEAFLEDAFFVVNGDTYPVYVRVYSKGQELAGMAYIDFGVSAFRRAALAHIPAGEPADLSVVYHALIAQRQLLAYENPHRFYEIGSLEGLREFEALVQSGAIPAPGESAALG